MKIWRLTVIVFCLLSITSVHGKSRSYLVLRQQEPACLRNSPFHVIGAVAIDDRHQTMTIQLMVPGGNVNIHMDMNAEGTEVHVSVINPQGALTVASSRSIVSSSFVQALIDFMGQPSTWLTGGGTICHSTVSLPTIQRAQRVLYDRDVVSRVDGVRVSFGEHHAVFAMNARYKMGRQLLNPGRRTNGRTCSVTPLNDDDLQRLLSLFFVAFLTPQLVAGEYRPPAQKTPGYQRPVPVINWTEPGVDTLFYRQPADRQRVQVPAAQQPYHNSQYCYQPYHNSQYCYQPYHYSQYCYQPLFVQSGGPNYPVGGPNVRWPYYLFGQQYHARQQAGAVAMDPRMQQQLEGIQPGEPPLYCRWPPPPWLRRDWDRGPGDDHGFGGGAMQYPQYPQYPHYPHYPQYPQYPQYPHYPHYPQ